MEYFENLLADWPYLTWALVAATTFYVVTAFAVSHLHSDKKANLALWLQGDHESTWPAQFGAMFDSIFGENHLRLRCFILSSLASVAAVFALWLLFDHVLGLISLRADTNLSLGEALLLGAAINIIPDYISLYETRWLLKQFERIRNPFGQLLVLIVDAIITGFIIYLGVMVYLWVTGEEPVSLVEMIALFSLYAVFFYSTFLTSIWAWAYCLSSWVSKLSARLRGWLDVKHAPGKSLALIGAVIVLAGSLAVKPVLTLDKEGRTAADDLLCDLFPASACMHVARLTKDEKKQLVLLGNACLGGVTEECLSVGQKIYQVDPEEAVKLWGKSCGVGEAKGCTNLGVIYKNAHGTKQDYSRAIALLQQGCDGGEAGGCTNLGVMYENADGIPQDYSRSAELYEQGCEGGDATGCAYLADLYERGAA
jgi:hypothetical protein